MTHIDAGSPDFLDFEVSEQIRAELFQRGIVCRRVTNLRYLEAWTHTGLGDTLMSRHIDPSLLKINFEVLIYNDVYAVYTFRGKDVFCVELHSHDLAAMQAQLFDFVWSQAVPMRRAGPGGACRVDKRLSRG